MADLLEAGIEALRQHVDVIAERFGGAVECRIGHHHRSREIICKGDSIEPPRRLVERARAGDDRLEHRAQFGKPELERQLERAAGPVDQLGNQQLPAMPVEPPERLAHHVDRHDAGDDGMLFA